MTFFEFFIKFHILLKIPPLIHFIIIFLSFNKFIRGQWTTEEDIVLLERFIQYNKKWATISESLKGRNLNSVKNRFHSILKKNNISEPDNEQIKSLIQKLKFSETVVDNDQINEIDDDDNDDEEIKEVEANGEKPKKQIKLEENMDKQENQIKYFEMFKNMQNQYQMFQQYCNFANAFNTTQRPPAFFPPGIPPNFMPNPLRNTMNFNPMMASFLNPESSIKSMIELKKYNLKDFF